jgi:GNAT superfamily N-acetyltransferase
VDRWLDRIRDSMVATWELVAESSPGGRFVRRDGVFAAVVPATPHRSVMNSVLYTDREALLASLEELARIYDGAGVEAWTVWVPEGDAEAERALEGAGHVFDAEPRAMGLELSDLDQPELEGIEWERGCDLVTVGRINDAAYGYGDRGMESVIGSLPPDRVHSYAARVDSEPVAASLAIDVDDDTEVTWVATTEAARGRGLATALVHQSLWDARERGRLTATLQATKRGAPVYRRIGFRDFGALHMWERRRS